MGGGGYQRTTETTERQQRTHNSPHRISQTEIVAKIAALRVLELEADFILLAVLHVADVNLSAANEILANAVRRRVNHVRLSRTGLRMSLRLDPSTNRSQSKTSTTRGSRQIFGQGMKNSSDHTGLSVLRHTSDLYLENLPILKRQKGSLRPAGVATEQGC